MSSGYVKKAMLKDVFHLNWKGSVLVVLEKQCSRMFSGCVGSSVEGMCVLGV